MFERYTERARQVVVIAQDEARKLKHNYIGGEHLLFGIASEEHGVGAAVLAEHGVTPETIHAFIVGEIGEGTEVLTGQIPLTPRAKKMLELSLREALSLGHNYVATEHLLLGLLRETEGVAATFLSERDVTADDLRNSIIRKLTGKRQTAIVQTPPEETPAAAYRRGWNDGYGTGIRESAS